MLTSEQHAGSALCAQAELNDMFYFQASSAKDRLELPARCHTATALQGGPPGLVDPP